MHQIASRLVRQRFVLPWFWHVDQVDVVRELAIVVQGELRRVSVWLRIVQDWHVRRVVHIPILFRRNECEVRTDISHCEKERFILLAQPAKIVNRDLGPSTIEKHVIRQVRSGGGRRS